MARLFLSYARTDVDRARQLAGLLGDSGHDVWWDRELHGGSRFATEIDKALQDAQAVVVLWSKSSLDSAWVQDEAAEGRDSGRLVPVVLDASRPPLGFRQYQAISLADWNGGAPDEMPELLRAISRTCGGEEAPESAAKPVAEAQPKHSICVLPFNNMSGDPEQEYFSDGITEDIITDLSKVSALFVIARNTAFTFKNQVMDVKDVAAALDVTHVLEGSVRKAGSRVRITAQLIDAKTGGHLWAERYDRELNDIFAIQDEISKAIVAALRVKLLPAEKKALENRGTASVDAYNIYLKARQYWISGTYGEISKEQTIVRLCRQATALDPEYAQAWALMALAQAELRFWHGLDENPLPAAERALALNPDLPEARCVKARYLEQEGKVDEANQEVDKAIALDPDSWEVNREAARLTFRQGRMREAAGYFEKAAQVMPTDFHSPGMLLSCYFGLKDNEGRTRAAKMSLERSEAALAKDPANSAALASAASALVLMGDVRKAKEYVNRALLLDPDNVSVLYNLGCALTVELNNPEEALDVLDLFFERVQSPTILKHSEADPDLDPVRDLPRYKTMFAAAKERLGMITA
jgi:adenylate cyclase